MEEGDAEEYRKQLLELQKARQLELQTREFLKQILSPEAYERMANIRLANKELYNQLVQVLIYLRQQGVSERISEEKLKELVSRIVSRRKETVIKRK